MTHLQKTGTGFLLRVFGTGFWCVCHWHNPITFLKFLELIGKVYKMKRSKYKVQTVIAQTVLHTTLLCRRRVMQAQAKVPLSLMTTVIICSRTHFCVELALLFFAAHRNDLECVVWYNVIMLCCYQYHERFVIFYDGATTTQVVSRTYKQHPL